VAPHVIAYVRLAFPSMALTVVLMALAGVAVRIAGSRGDRACRQTCADRSRTGAGCRSGKPITSRSRFATDSRPKPRTM
jgi:hypothetical protein